jgi:hypothetical protein
MKMEPDALDTAKTSPGAQNIKAGPDALGTAQNEWSVMQPFFACLTTRGDGLRKKDTEIPLSVHWGVYHERGMHI